ncbi:uncharacterized protein LOC122647682 isoform X2 [Telopea speciosissima]|uniref:uncharacterized protein LOC122647682 isoform X2 n=1 Tax=Telopea speciosissima TaxID=54955 RepID=UPI001CC6204F|nr:uncharacterized protein LOC122647682 isoform X2 [Telopea speciosissima]XP_043696990.1 uncharacterized protein LOC122647682 isoform X2 [Telopea speciosissima]XP_043696992.1 uncharacterized protein LOC122647682 isoform X2 [Telopea speciosissima]
MAQKAWKIIPRPLLETVLNNHVQHLRVSQPLILHGLRGAGKTTLILNRLLDDWNKGPHITGYVDFGLSVEDHHRIYSNQSSPWASWSNVPPPTLPSLRSQLERCLESMVQRGVRLGTIGPQQVFSTLNKWHSLNSALRSILQNHTHSSTTIDDKVSTSWSRALFALSARSKANEIDAVLGLDDKGKTLTLEETSYFREALLSLRLAKEVLQIHQSWRANAVSHLNRTGGFSRSLANSSTDWPYLLLELLSAAAEVDNFQPKLVINNIDVLRDAVLTDDSTLSASMYHDSLLWRLIALGVTERCLPVILLTSDSYYSYRASMDFGYPDLFISRETFGWTPQEAKMHMVTDFFTESEWRLIAEMLGPNP